VGYRVIALKPVKPFLDLGKLSIHLFPIKPGEIVLFSRQLALLLESGVDIVSSLELLEEQTSNRSLKKVLEEAVADIRGGNPLSTALGKHPESFSPIYCRSLSVGEQSGNLEKVLRQMADYIEKESVARKDIKNALKYPMIVSIVAVIVIAVIVTFVLPAFTSMYSLFNVELPLITRLLLSMVEWLTAYGLYLVGALAVIIAFAFVYIRTPEGKLAWDRLTLRLPLLGRIAHLSELSHCCRSMSLLFGAGLPLPEALSLVSEGSDNKVVKNILTDVRRDMIRGEGLSRPMAKSALFLPLMVQMVRVGEETGNLDATLLTVAQTFETEAEDRMRTLIGLIQPTITVVIGMVVAFIALSLVSAMYSIYGQVL
jgi:type IV pilus assembly protein PilC